MIHLTKTFSQYIFLFGSLAFTIGCTESRPRDILSEGEMVQIMAELYIAEEKLNRMGLRRDSSEFLFEEVKTRIFQNQQKSDTVFKKSLQYYKDRPKQLERLYGILVDSLNLREQRMNAQETRVQ